MNTKIIEIRDTGTNITALAIKLDGDNFIENTHLKRAGFGSGNGTRFILLTNMENMQSNYDPFKWNDRTLNNAHRYLVDNFDNIENCGLIDVQFLIGETKNPVVSEIFKEAN